MSRIVFVAQLQSTRDLQRALRGLDPLVGNAILFALGWRHVGQCCWLPPSADEQRVWS